MKKNGHSTLQGTALGPPGHDSIRMTKSRGSLRESRNRLDFLDRRRYAAVQGLADALALNGGAAAEKPDGG